MKRFVFLIIFVFSVCFFAGCENKTVSRKPVIKTGVALIADNEVAIIEMEEPAYGKFTIELYSNIAPEMVARFKELAREGVYNGTSFHRINQAVVQGGDPFSKDDNPQNDGQGNSGKPNIPAEFSDIPYDAGIVGAARTQDFNSQNSQFFITLRRTPEFDRNYTVFGKVVDGINNVRTIAGAPRQGERPLDRLIVKSVTIQNK